MIQKIEYTCPNCDEYYLIYDGVGNMPPQKYAQLKEIVKKQIKLGYCKKCHRKDPKVPTTFEMDGLITKEEMRDRKKVVLQCRDCKKWTQMKHDKEMQYTPCGKCGSTNYDPTSIKSLRTYNETTDNKRKPKVKK